MPGHPSHNRDARPVADAPSALRSDARENRERVLKAARAAFAEQGLDVPLTAVARRAGVGVATLYRRFPTREALVTAAFADQLAECAAVLDAALADPDPWRGLCALVETVGSLQAADRGFTAAFLARFPDALDHHRERARAERGLTLLVRRAQEAGALRADFDPSDLVLLLLATDGVTARTGPAAAAASRRLSAYLLQAFRAGPHAPLPPPAPLDLRQLHVPTAAPGT
ncbi:TetR/AcrR family transcriptional regulator [Streptomyces tagetis]|uniref:TetR/AcrR family transcriptional regulator n=1 Tax=Streptomyces tagetis TaxID=2820809 RepID=A0A941AY79_9ACTN|nr:TetR/AcrR family transcriptional regulator [Streptomyces sp. RG38]MBQ0827109.1 TetR/AcrR family transcriptional regulator [Streptomyces sp. RG38]